MQIAESLVFPEISWGMRKEPQFQGEPLLEQMIERLKGGDSEAFEGIIALTQRKAFALVYHITRDYHQAQDILQEAYVRVYCNINRLRNPMSFRSWFLRIVVNLSRDYMRFRKFFRVPEDPSSVENSPVERAPGDSVVTRERLQELLKILSAQERRALLLRELYQLTYEEISGILSMPLGTVKSTLHKSKKKLVNLIAKTS